MSGRRQRGIAQDHMADPHYFRDGKQLRPTPEDEAAYARAGSGPFPTGFCVCGHHFTEHHDPTSTAAGPCEFFGSNEEEGLDWDERTPHCFRYCDKGWRDEKKREWEASLERARTRVRERADAEATRP